MQNNSGIYPKGHRVLVKPFEITTTTESGIILYSLSEQDREDMAQTEGVIVAIGNTAWADVKDAFAEVGDRVVFAKYSGLLRTGKDGVKYRIINDLDVVATLDKIEETENV